MSHLLDPLDSSLLDALGSQGRLEQFGSLLELADPETNPPVRRIRWQSGASPDQRMATTHYFYEDERFPDRPTTIRDAHGAGKKLT